ncbi:hypothetical protein [Salinisphaera sp. Q1T1-3]|uniref:transglycosylase SLT domain-containing protein n=1 Tax=Salinisphaera sp. Q1T1-3 TaxID=2321229 RepID=UPI000E731FC0|nr:hypothetical protein [Salinisphaera sp. Q1T1-3]RJS94336.1 hypothetical protein D3260_04310 [Salinisphaera sp. Q1T1-3]
MRAILLILIVAPMLAGCITAPPSNPSNLCSIFREKHGWYDAAEDAQKRWGAPIPVQMSIIYQESQFQADAAPPRNRLFWIIPWTRISSAYGYTQALDSTWSHYKDQAGHPFARRDSFDSAVDFVGWYVDQSHRILGISKADAYSQYLAYYLGPGGYRQGLYRQKSWLRRSASRVASRSSRYGAQLSSCRGELERQGHWWWPF